MDRPFPLDYNSDPNPRIITVGMKGSGKSTLINALFGDVVAEVGTRPDVTMEVKEYDIDITKLKIIDTPGFGGLNEKAEEVVRDYLKLDSEDNVPLIGDMIIFLFSWHRLDKNEFEVFREINEKYHNRLIIVKNYIESETEKDFIENKNIIKKKIGKYPICVDAKEGENIEELIKEMLIFFSPKKMDVFNQSLFDHHRKAKEMAFHYTVKIASICSVIKRNEKQDMSRIITRYKRELNEKIIESYLKEPPSNEILSSVETRPSSGTVIDNSGLKGLASFFGTVTGGAIGLIGGPLGVGIGAILGLFFGVASVKNVMKGGTNAVVNIVTQGYAITELIEAAQKDPRIYLLQNQKQYENWLMKNDTLVEGILSKAERKTKHILKNDALIEYLNHPNETDPSIVEEVIKPSIERIFFQ